MKPGRWNDHRSGDRSGNYPIYKDEVIRDQTTDKTLNGLLEIEVKVGIEMRIMMLEVEVETEIIEEERNPDLDPTAG